MRFMNGEHDKLFLLPVIEDAYPKMCVVWESECAGDELETRFYDVSNLFNQAMRDEAFAWLDRQFKNRKPKPR